MNDSFLEDLELVSNNPNVEVPCHVTRHVTTRNAMSTPLHCLSDNDNSENFAYKCTVENPKITIHSASSQSKQREVIAKESKRQTERDVKKQVIKASTSHKKEKSVDGKLTPVENKIRIDSKERGSKEEAKVKLREVRVKNIDGKGVNKDHVRRSGSYKENDRSSSTSSKENNHPNESSKGNSSTADSNNDKRRLSADTSRKSDPLDKDPVAFLTAIKDLISTYTKQESTKILRAMQELHMNSQASLIRNLLFQKDDLIKEMHPSRDSTRMKTLIEENERLREDVIILQLRNGELQKKLEELEFLKQENVSLKLKCKELSKQ